MITSNLPIEDQEGTRLSTFTRTSLQTQREEQLIVLPVIDV